jgi:hypothetical protein
LRPLHHVRRGVEEGIDPHLGDTLDVVEVETVDRRRAGAVLGPPDALGDVDDHLPQRLRRDHLRAVLRKLPALMLDAVDQSWDRRLEMVHDPHDGIRGVHAQVRGCAAARK